MIRQIRAMNILTGVCIILSLLGMTFYLFSIYSYMSRIAGLSCLAIWAFCILIRIAMFRRWLWIWLGSIPLPIFFIVVLVSQWNCPAYMSACR